MRGVRTDAAHASRQFLDRLDHSLRQPEGEAAGNQHHQGDENGQEQGESDLPILEQDLVVQQVIARAALIGDRQTIGDAVQMNVVEAGGLNGEYLRQRGVIRAARGDIAQQGDGGGRQGVRIAGAPGMIILHFGIERLVDQAFAGILGAEIEADGDHQGNPATDSGECRGDTGAQAAGETHGRPR